MTRIVKEQDIKFNVVMPVVNRDFAFLKKTVEYILTFFNPHKIIFIINFKYLSFFPKSILNNKKCFVIDEDHIIEGLSYVIIDNILKKQNRKHTKTGWYFQQFLKMGFSMTDYCDTDYYLAWDSDTIPLRKIDFFDENQHPFFSMKTEYHKPYFDTICQLLNLTKLNPRSYIAEHMMFNRNVMMDLINRIEKSNVEGNTWYEKIMNSLVDEIVSPFSFSEFETYGTFCSYYYPDLYKERQLPGIRGGGLIQGRFVSNRILNDLAKDMFVASFEIYDRPPFPWSFICDIYERYQRCKFCLLKYGH